ncbi:MAG: hypothetical protein JXA44_07445 [Methanospirillaceae archaeon]|nr:hypothetical protein [Methanospirillaceae archaeon]
MNDLIVCPKCGKKSVTIQNPDQYEYWLTCSECDYFQGISTDEWHKIHNSPHLVDKLRKLYEKEHKKSETQNHDLPSCILCKKAHKGKTGPLGKICTTCWYKVGILIFVLMVIISYSIWIFVL